MVAGRLVGDLMEAVLDSIFTSFRMTVQELGTLKRQ